MKPALISFAATLALLALNVAPSPEQLRPQPTAAEIDFAVRHAHEQANQVEAELGLDQE
jgi:hypothetical protein